MIKTIIFDWGEVCTEKHLLHTFSQKLSSICHLDFNLIEQTFREFELSYETGKISPTEFWKNFKERLHLKMPIKSIQQIFYESDTINEEVLKLILTLKGKYQLILLTNNYEDMFKHIQKKFNLKKYFDFLFSSSGIHYKKPSKEIYQYLIDTLKLNPLEVVMIDNKEKNLLVPQDLGMKVILFKNINLLKKELISFKVLTAPS